MTRILGITLAVALCCVAFGRTQEPCGRDGCPAKVRLLSAPAPTPYAAMPVGSGPTVVYAHPLVAEVRTEHPLRTFICECRERAQERREARRARR